MADITWPATLPQYVDQNGYQEARVSGKLETEMDSGPKSMRRLYTATPVVFSIPINIDIYTGRHLRHVLLYHSKAWDTSLLNGSIHAQALR